MREAEMVRLLALAGLIAALSVPAAAQAATSVQKAPFAGDVVLCTSGDVVHLSGTLLTTVTESQTSSGGFLEAIHFQPQGISGVDTTTGTDYHATGLTRDLLVSSPAGGSTETSVNRFHIQATRSAESFIVKGVFHITVSSTGTVRVVIDKFSATC
jgi:hypothetical protein